MPSYCACCCWAPVAAAEGGGSNEEAGAASPSSKPGVNDINPTDRAELADGGKLTWPIDTFPSNFNLGELDGALADGAAIMGALMPGMFNFDAEAGPVVNPDYAESAVLTATEPKQIVTYKLNPKATWDDGTPITVADFEAQWKALAGTDDRFRIASSNGYEKIESVAKGADDKEVVVTYASPFVDWQGLFSPLYPASTSTDPAVFNDGWKQKPLTTAGPFKLGNVDNTAQLITLVRNEKWWGRAAKLDSLVFRKIDRDAQPDALANGEIDFMGIGSDVNRLKRAESSAGIAIRRSAAPNFNHMTINGKSPILSDAQRPQGAGPGHRPGGHRQGAARPARREDDAARQPHLHDQPEGLPGQQHDPAAPTPRRRPSSSTMPAGSWRATPA